jgi:hypothetical protein
MHIADLPDDLVEALKDGLRELEGIEAAEMQVYAPK